MGHKGVTRSRAPLELHGIAPQQAQEFAVRIDGVGATGSANGNARVPKQAIAGSIGVGSTFVSAAINLKYDRCPTRRAIEEVDPATSDVARNLTSDESIKGGLRDQPRSCLSRMDLNGLPERGFPSFVELV
jgi:hypothetical protein